MFSVHEKMKHIKPGLQYYFHRLLFQNVAKGCSKKLHKRLRKGSLV